MNRYLSNVYTPQYQQMWQATAKMVTDVGLKDPCENIKIDGE